MRRSKITRFLADEAGATAVEYGMLAVMISLVLVGALTTLGSGIRNKFLALATVIAGS